jgi:LPXTG-motif cell wall-anchored protein
MARRTLAVALVALAALSPATSAFAHAGNPNYESIVRTVAPAIPGFTVEVLNGDDRLEVANRGSSTVTIDGYNSEPYVRLSPDGSVAVNTKSPALYLNQDRTNEGTVPPTADAKAAPQWKVVERTGRYEFHDHRMHWMGASTPSQIKDKSARTKVFDWKVPVHTATANGAIDGELFWRGSTGGAPAGAFAGLALIVLLGAAAVVVVRRRRAAAADAPAREEAW